MERSHPTARWRRYLWVLCGLSALIVASLVAMNYLVDPYLTHQWDSAKVARLRPPREKLSAWGKTYAIARYHPAVLYLGNSRTELGLSTRLPAFARQTVFNGALSGASVGDAIAMARHARSFGRLDTVVWGLDAPSFELSVGTGDFDRALVADGSSYFARRGLLNLKRALTFDMTEDSISLLGGGFGAVCRSSLAFNGQRDEACMAARMADWGGTGAVVAPRIREFMRGAGPDEAARQAFADALDALCAGGTRIRLYINPTHATMLDALYWRGKWAAMERWQAGLTDIAATRRAAGCDVRLYDFSGFNSVTTEPIPQVSGLRDMRYYWEPSHYRAEVGRMIVQRMFGGDGALPADFGVALAPPMLAAHQAATRRERERYHAEHGPETALTKNLAQAELTTPP